MRYFEGSSRPAPDVPPALETAAPSRPAPLPGNRFALTLFCLGRSFNGARPNCGGCGRASCREETPWLLRRRSPEPAEAEPHGADLRLLTLGALGVVYGDIGTSPLYTLREAFGHAGGLHLSEAAVLGVLSLVFWSLIFVVTREICRADPARRQSRRGRRPGARARWRRGPCRIDPRCGAGRSSWPWWGSLCSTATG